MCAQKFIFFLLLVIVLNFYSDNQKPLQKVFKA